MLKFGAKYLLIDEYVDWFRVIIAFLILALGVFVLTKTAKIIEETSGILSEKTKIAGGLLQSFGTAFPDMVLGIVAAIMALSVMESDYERAINFAIIAAAATFGSNVYNIAHAAWCVFRQNLANKKSQEVLMFPGIVKFGKLQPMQSYNNKLSIKEVDVSINVSTALTIITTFVAISMVIFGHVKKIPSGMSGDLYQLIAPVGLFILACCMFTLFHFRKSEKNSGQGVEENYYRDKSNLFIVSNLIVSGIIILSAAEGMVNAVEIFCEIFNIPFVIAGVFIGIIGCLGEMIVVHNFSVNPNGRIGDAIVGVVMDNIVTICGAAIIAIMGGIFLGGSALILIFVIILCLNTILMWQISELKNHISDK